MSRPAPTQPQTIQDLGRLVKTKHPGSYDDLPDIELGRRVKTKYPAAYSDFADVAQPSVAAPPPEPPPSEAFPMSAKEAAYRAVTGDIPGLLFGAATAPPSEMSEHALAVLKLMPEAVTGLPGMIGSVGSALWQNLKGIYGHDPAALEKGIEQSKQLIRGAVRGMTAPVTVPARGAAALLAPKKFEAPSREESLEAAGAAGAMLSGTLFGVGAAKAGAQVGRFIREAPVRKGYTTINPETMKPEAPVQAVKAEIGVKVPRMAPGTMIEFSEPVRLASKALGGDISLEVGDTIRRVFNEAFPDLKHAQQQNPYLRGAMNSPQKFKATVQWARNRVWREGMEPAFKAAGDVDLTPVADQLISEIPESIRVQRPRQALALEKTFNEMFDGKVVKAETLHEFAKEARAKIQAKLAKNSFDRQAAFGTPDGKMAESFNTALRDRLYQHVQQKTGVDLRPIAERYGALSELEQEALGLTATKSVLEQLFTGYTFPTKRAITARVGQRLGQHMISDMKLLERAFDKYKLEPQKITQSFRLRARAAVLSPSNP